MSNPFGNYNGILIHQDVAENPGAVGLRKTKREDIQGKQPANKRAALGTITNTTRIQPSRAAKQATSTDVFATSNENAKAKTFGVTATNTQAFSIHCDDGETVPVSTLHQDSNSSTDKLQLHAGITTLRQPLSTVAQPIVLDDSNLESPMVLDTSLDIQAERDVKQEDRMNCILTVPEYSDDIYKYLRQLELRHRAKPNYMKRQPDITNSMRCILVDWLVEVAEEYKLHRETLFLSVNYIDRFLSQMSVLRGKLQLVGAASMFLAAKYEEIYPPEVGEFVYITDDTYTKKQVLRMEHLILKVLSFDVAVPTINCFCERFLKAVDADDRTKALAMYLAELTLVESDPFLSYAASEIGVASVCLARHILGQDALPEALSRESGYQLGDIENVLRDLYSTFCKASTHPQQAIRDKYKQAKFHQVASLQPPLNLPGGISFNKPEVIQL